MSDRFDCDDGALLMMERFKSIGITSTPVLGNLKKTGEQYLEIDHVWLLADIAGIKVAFDWGAPCPDNQHYEGFPITREQLLFFIDQDKTAPGLVTANPAQP